MLPAPRVASLHSYPVKSMLGQSVDFLDLDQRGCVGDRVWSVRTAAGKIGSGKNSRRFAAVSGLLHVRATTRAGEVSLVFPDGTTLPVADAEAAEHLSSHVGQPVTLAKETSLSHFDDGPVSLLGLASVAAVSRERSQSVDPSRFRPNIVLDVPQPFGEDEWVGRTISLGSAVIDVTMTSTRCVMVDASTADLAAQPGNLLAVGRLNGTCLGVVGTVAVPGTISVGDAVAVL